MLLTIRSVFIECMCAHRCGNMHGQVYSVCVNNVATVGVECRLVVLTERLAFSLSMILACFCSSS